jgi:hypothetical protein
MMIFLFGSSSKMRYGKRKTEIDDGDNDAEDDEGDWCRPY